MITVTIKADSSEASVSMEGAANDVEVAVMMCMRALVGAGWRPVSVSMAVCEAAGTLHESWSDPGLESRRRHG